MAGDYTTRAGQRLVPGAVVATGAQAEVLAVAGRTDVVFKRYFSAQLLADRSIAERITTMVAHPARGWKEAISGHVIAAWPTDLISQDRQLVGYLMANVAGSGTRRLADFVSGGEQWREVSRESSWRDRVAVATHLARAVDMMHESGTVIGDLDEQRVSVGRDLRVTFLGCDRMQVTEPATKRVFPGQTGRPDLTPPELRGADPALPRRASSDLYGLAVQLHRILLYGEEPFGPTGNEPWVYAQNPLPMTAIGLSILPLNIASLFRRTFEVGMDRPEERPTALAWHTALASLNGNLSQCQRRAAHQFWIGHRVCPWCVRAARPDQRVELRATHGPEDDSPIPVTPPPEPEGSGASRGAVIAVGGLAVVGALAVVLTMTAGGKPGNNARANAPTTSASDLQRWLLDGTVNEATNRQTARTTGGVSWVAGRTSGGAAHFDGTGSITTARPVVLTDKSFTIATWVKITDVKDFRTAVSMMGKQKPMLALQYRPPQNAFCITAVPSDSSTVERLRVCATKPPVLGAWTHLVAVYDAAREKITLYVNGGKANGGETVEAPFTTAWRATGPMAVGCGEHLGKPDDFWVGDIDDVRVYERAVRVEELAALKEST